MLSNTVLTISEYFLYEKGLYVEPSSVDIHSGQLKTINKLQCIVILISWVIYSKGK